MGLHVRVENGTQAGRRRPLRPSAADWRCRCVVFEARPGTPMLELDPDDDCVGTDADGNTWIREDRGSPWWQIDGPRVIVWRRQRGYLTRCFDCGANRPE